MKIISCISQKTDTEIAIKECIMNLKEEFTEPSILLCYLTEEYDEKIVLSLLKEYFPTSKIHGCSSCQGIMTNDGFASNKAIAVWGLIDFKNGRYGTSISQYEDNDNVALLTIQLLESAISDSGREGELPSLILLHATSGHEEIIISTIDDFFGTAVPLIGGTAADNHNKGNWCIFTQEDIVNTGISISIFYPSCKVSYSFHSGYAPFDISGIVTKTNKRTLYEIDNRPIIDVYKEWTQMSELINKEQNLLEHMAQYPLGRIAGYMDNVPYFKLAHPAKITHDGGIECFADINVGDEIYMMYGEKDQIISRPQRVINSAIGYQPENFIPIGGVNIFCAGSMMHIKSSMLKVYDSVTSAMHDAPFICPFTFGEQGRFTGGENAHGNLMVSTVLFHY